MHTRLSQLTGEYKSPQVPEARSSASWSVPVSVLRVTTMDRALVLFVQDAKANVFGRGWPVFLSVETSERSRMEGWLQVLTSCTLTFLQYNH